MRNSVFDGSFTQTRTDFPALTQLTAWKGKASALSDWSQKQLGAALPAAGTSVAAGDQTMFSTGPNRWLVSGEVDSGTFDASAGAMLDLGSARCLFELRGDHLDRLLNKGTAVPLDDMTCADGSVVLTTIDHMTVMIHKKNLRAFDLYAFSSFVDSLEHWLATASNDLKRLSK